MNKNWDVEPRKEDQEAYDFYVEEDRKVPLPEGRYASFIIRLLKHDLRESMDTFMNEPWKYDLHAQRSRVLLDCYKEVGGNNELGKFINEHWGPELWAKGEYYRTNCGWITRDEKIMTNLKNKKWFEIAEFVDKNPCTGPTDGLPKYTKDKAS